MIRTSTLMYEMIEDLGLSDFSDVDKLVGKMKHRDFRMIYEQLIGIYENLENDISEIRLKKNSFKIVPGGRLNLKAVNVCFNPYCRTNALEKSCKHLVMYADIIIMDDPLFQPLSLLNGKLLDKDAVTEFINGLYLLLSAKPMAENNMLLIVPDRREWWNLCPKCKRQLLSDSNIPYDKALNTFIDLADVSIKKEHDETYEICVHHPDHPDHPLMTYPEELPKFIKNKLRLSPEIELSGYRLSKPEIRKFDDVTEDFLYPSCIQLLWGASLAERIEANFLTDSITQWKLLKESEGVHSSVEQNLHFEIPFIEGIDLAELIAIRKSEPVSFEKLRLTLADIRRRYSEGEFRSQKHLRYYLRERIIPEINIIEEDIRALKRKTSVNVLSTAALGGILAFIGFYEGSISPTINGALQQIGFLGLALKGVHICTEHFGKLDELRSRASYFLWRTKHAVRPR